MMGCCNGISLLILCFLYQSLLEIYYFYFFGRSMHVAFVVGRNEKGQLGTGNLERSDIPVELEELKDLTIVGAACGRNHTLFLTGKTVKYKSSVTVLIIQIALYNLTIKGPTGYLITDCECYYVSSTV